MFTAVAGWFTAEHVWALVGGGAQLLFASRFIIQWYRSEAEGRSVIPVSFWYASLFGGIVMTAYVIHLGSVSLILGQASGLIVYVRNLWLIHKEKAMLRAAAEAGSEDDLAAERLVQAGPPANPPDRLPAKPKSL